MQKKITCLTTINKILSPKAVEVTLPNGKKAIAFLTNKNKNSNTYLLKDTKINVAFNPSNFDVGKIIP